MTKQYNAATPKGDQGKRVWTAPELTRLEAAQAELGTRVDVADGGFTTS
jgi:hypothetical protein